MKSKVYKIAMFPLNVIVLPGEEIPLRIFEPRYKQLITECEESKQPFAIPYLDGSRLSEIGSEVELSQVIGKNNRGDMVIMIRGRSLFRMVEFIPELPDKLYGGGLIEPVHDDFSTTNSVLAVLVKKLRINLKPDLGTLVIDSSINMLDVGKSLMLKSHEKFKLVSLPTKEMKEKMLINHLRFVEMIHSQENKLENNFQLN